MWNYRIIKTTHGEEDFYSIHEVYYNRAGEICAISEDPMEPHGSNLSEIGRDLDFMAEAFTRPVLMKDEIVFAKADWEEEE